jgi:hypothetical protein
MNRMRSSMFLLAPLALAAALLAQQQPEPPPQRPRLVVLCSVDQLARWVLEEARPFFAAEGGFRRLADTGVEFTQCAFEHACTETGPGHATIGTGAPASVHGIVRNEWWSPQDGGKVYCVRQQAEALPDLPEGRNRGPARLAVPTFADGLKARVPGSKVASVSWKDRSAILMAGGAADVVAWIETKTGNLVTNKLWAKETPEWIRAWNERRPLDGFHGWNWDLFGPPEAYEGLVDDRSYEMPHQNGSNQHTLPQSVTGGKDGPDAAFYFEAFASPVGNTIVRQAAESVVTALSLGADDVPDLLCVSFSSTDVIGHQFGPDSVEARDGLLRLDRELATLLAFLDDQVGAGRYAFFLTADHGVGPTPEWAKERGLDAGRGLLLTHARAAAEKALRDRFGAPPRGKRWFAHAGEFSLLLDRDVVRSLAGEADAEAMLREAARVAAEAATATAGIASAFATQDLLDEGPRGDPVRQALLHAIHPGRTGDVLLVGKPYWLDGMLPAASHGTPYDYDREVAAFAAGPRVARGVRITAPVTPGLGVVLFAELLGIPKPPGAVENVPEGVLDAR